MAELTVQWRSIFFLVVTNWFCRTEAENDDTRIVLCFFGVTQECAPPIPVSRLLGRGGFGDAVGSVKNGASDDIQKKMFLGGCLTWNYISV